MDKLFWKRNAAFTLIEVLTVITIIGVLAAIAMPSYTLHVEKVKASEGVGLLTVLLAAQERFRLENNSYATAIGSLDVDIPNSANFNLPPNLYDAAARVATLSRSDGTYTLCINSTGVVSCNGAANICSSYAPGGAGICP